MATKNEEEEPKVPVFTVIKNGAILKNIFIVNNNTCPSSEPTSDQILIIGRHPDCNIMLTHPSISRFHLKIISDPSSQNLAVIDLSSVHGTWVSEKKIEPGNRVELHEGDSLRIGGSSRVYRLHWIPLSQAYDVEIPYVSASDEPMEGENEDGTALEACQDENSMPVDDEPVVVEVKTMPEEMEEKEEELGISSLFLETREIQSLDLIGEDLNLYFDENLEIAARKETPSVLAIPQHPIYSLFDENEEGAESPLKDAGEEKEILRHCDTDYLRGESENLGSEGVSLDNEFSGYDIDTQSSEQSFLTKVLEGESREVTREIDNRIPFQGDIFCCNQSLESSPSTKGTCESEFPKISTGELDNSSLVKDCTGLTEKSTLLVGEVIAESGDQHTCIEYRSRGASNHVESLSQKLELENFLAEQKPNSFVNFDYSASETLQGMKDTKESMKGDELRDVSVLESVNSSVPAENVVPETPEDRENWNPQSRYVAEGMTQLGMIKNSPMKSDNRSSFGSIWLRRGKPANAIQLQTGESREETMLGSVDSEGENHDQENMENKSTLKEAFSSLNGEKDEIFTPDKENFTTNTLLIKSLKRKGKLVNSDDKRHNQDCGEDTSILKANDSSLDGEEDEISTPDKENFQPKPLLPKSLRKKGVLEEIKLAKPGRLSPLKVTSSPSTHPEENFEVSPNNESLALRVLQELKPPTSGNKGRLHRELLVNKRRPERVPFQSLVAQSNNTIESSAGGASSDTRSCVSINYTQPVEKKKITSIVSNNSVRQSKRAWTMVADTSTLLNKQSRKNLQLLQGLKQTCLVIPRMVLKELDSLKQRGSLFRRKTEACLVLEWIEQCMVEKTSWIRVQSSAEDGRLTAPTPPASPQTPFSNGGGWSCRETTCSLPFLRRRSLVEIVSPTTEDHILECALLCRKLNSDRQVVLLSNDVTLKINAMGEGLLCETVQEFRESLINPFSERFLWADSSPRGQTWSITDDVVLREKYDCFALKRQLKGESAKGLKLILLHNSHYGHQWAHIS